MKKYGLLVFHEMLFLILEASCASRIIWYYDWSQCEGTTLLILALFMIIFDILLLHYKDKLFGAPPISSVVKGETVIITLFILTLILSFLLGKLKLYNMILAIIIQIVLFILRVRFLFCKTAKEIR